MNITKKKIDFLIVYEHKARELENACLLKYELEERGYSAEIVYFNYNKHKSSVLYYADTVLIPSCYNNFTIHFFTNNLVRYKKIVNMQWEQVFTIRQESIRRITGAAKHAINLSWGKQNSRKLIEDLHIDPSLVIITGNLTLDFLLPHMRTYYLSKRELFQLYDIPEDKKVCLFISSFAYCNFSQKILDHLISILGLPAQYMYDISNASQPVILEWMSKLLRENPNIFIIYRPHPAEVNSILLKEMEENVNNFRIIRERSVKQWIITCDIVYTWISTSITEAYYAGKVCHILRPFPVSKEDDAILYHDATFITDYQEFRDSTVGSNNKFSLSPEVLADLYDFDPQIPSYKRIVDLLENVRKDKKYILPRKEIQLCDNYPTKSLLIKFKIWFYSRIEKSFIFHIYTKLFGKGEYTQPVDDANTLEIAGYDFATQEEIESIMTRIALMLHKEILAKDK